MGQETQELQSETSVEREQTHERKKDESATGRDLPAGDGTLGDEEMNAIGSEPDNRPIGQDHSTERHESTEPDHGVGEFQRSSDTTSDNVHLVDRRESTEAEME